MAAKGENQHGFTGKKVLVAGCGKSGLGAAGLLQKAGAVPVLFDENEKLDGKALCAREDYPKDTALVLGSLPKELLSELSLAVLSPGISIEEAFSFYTGRGGYSGMGRN